MNLEGIERRREPRTQAFLPITFHSEGSDDDLPAHLLDLSSGGAALLTTAYDAPALGQYLDLHFEITPNNENGDDPIRRRETGMVVNLRAQGRGVTRLGVRFMQHRGISSDLFDPLEVLSDYRKHGPSSNVPSRWETARNFDRLPQVAATN